MATEHPQGDYERGEPKTAIIVFFAVVSVITIGLLQPAFESYFDSVVGRQEQAERVELEAYYQQYKDLEAEQLGSLEQSRLPLSRAVEQVAQNRGGIALLRPTAEQDLQAIAGWNAHPDYEDPPALPAEPEDGAEEAPAEAADPEAPAAAAEPPEAAPTMAPAMQQPPTMAAPAMAAPAMAAPAMAAPAMVAPAMAAPAMAAPATAAGAEDPGGAENTGN